MLCYSNTQKIENMEKIVYFEENENQKCIIRFVKGYRRRRWFLKEKICYSYSCIDGLPFIDEETLSKVCERVKKDYPHAKVHCEEFIEFSRKYNLQRFWVIAKWNKNEVQEFYNGDDQWRKPTYTTDINDVRMMLSKSSAEETLRTIQQTTRDRVWVMPVYLNMTNELLTPVMMITCTSKSGKQETKFFARIEGNRIRLVNTSDAAHKFTYEEVLRQFEFLQTHNKNFLYAVLPVFKHNVNYRNLEAYIRENNVSRMIVMDLQLRFLNR